MNIDLRNVLDLTEALKNRGHEGENGKNLLKC